MEDQAPYVAAVAYPEALAPYAAVLVAEGFEPEDWAPSSQPCLYATWQPVPQVYYFCDLVVVEKEVHAWLVRKPTGKRPFQLFHWTRVDTPEELRWLLQRSVRLGQARANPEDELGSCELFQTTPDCPSDRLIYQAAADQTAVDFPDADAAPG